MQKSTFEGPLYLIDDDSPMYEMDGKLVRKLFDLYQGWHKLQLVRQSQSFACGT